MNQTVTELIERISKLEEEVEAELRRRRTELQADFEHGKVRFEQEILKQQRRFKTGLVRYLVDTRLINILTAPVIYSCIFPLLLLDLFITIYQLVCFPVYGIARIRRSDYMVFDRGHLAYLNIIEKLHCAYCSYGNGLISYAKEVVSRTEQYFCPIKHAQRILDAHRRYHRFLDFGDAAAFRDDLEQMRKELGTVAAPRR